MTDQLLSVPVQSAPRTGEVPAAQRTHADLPTLPGETPGPQSIGVPVSVSCPGCGATASADLDGRQSSSFCRSCDYPLFWAVERRSAGGVGEGAGLRRLPGTAGRVALAHIPCPSCTEPNPPANAHCLRCGSAMQLAPVVEPEPEPTRVYEAVLTTPHWIWSWAGMALIVTLLLVAFTGIVYLTY